jgi:hypothetical protein
MQHATNAAPVALHASPCVHSDRPGAEHYSLAYANGRQLHFGGGDHHQWWEIRNVGGSSAYSAASGNTEDMEWQQLVSMVVTEHAGLLIIE